MMTTALRSRVERLEQAKPTSSLNDVPEATLNRRFDLLLRMYVHGEAGLPIQSFRDELVAMEPLGVDLGVERHIDDSELRERVTLVLRAEAQENASYRKLLDILQQAAA